MEQNRHTSSYRGITPLKKKVKKVTFTGAIIFCVICFFIGMFFGGVTSSNKGSEQAQQKIDDLTYQLEYERTQHTAEIDAYRDEINNLNKQIAQAKADNNSSNENVQTESNEAPTPAEENASPITTDDSQPKETSGGFFKKLITGVLIVVIIVCILFAASIFLKKNDNSEDDEEEYEDDEDEYEDDEEDYEDDEDDEYEVDEEDE